MRRDELGQASLGADPDRQLPLLVILLDRPFLNAINKRARVLR